MTPILYHAPNSRSDTILTILDAACLRASVEVREVTIPRRDGSGGRDPANPHPEGKVPYLVAGDEHVRERGAIILWLTDHFDSPLGRPVGHPQRGAYLSWLFWYQGVMEPVLMLHWSKVEVPAISASLRDWPAALAHLAATLADGRAFLLGDDLSAADVLIASPFAWFPDVLPEDPAIRAWAARVAEAAKVGGARAVPVQPAG